MPPKWEAAFAKCEAMGDLVELGYFGRPKALAAPAAASASAPANVAVQEDFTQRWAQRANAHMNGFQAPGNSAVALRRAAPLHSLLHIPPGQVW